MLLYKINFEQIKCSAKVKRHFYNFFSYCPIGIEASTDHQVWYLRTAKLALALAIIRSKPADKSSREYTEHLARVVSGQESEWRSKVESLEAEVLQLRQKLLLSKICSGLFKSGEYEIIFY